MFYGIWTGFGVLRPEQFYRDNYVFLLSGGSSERRPRGICVETNYVFGIWRVFGASRWGHFHRVNRVLAIWRGFRIPLIAFQIFETLAKLGPGSLGGEWPRGAILIILSFFCHVEGRRSIALGAFSLRKKYYFWHLERLRSVPLRPLH